MAPDTGQSAQSRTSHVALDPEAALLATVAPRGAGIDFRSSMSSTSGAPTPVPAHPAALVVGAEAVIELLNLDALSAGKPRTVSGCERDDRDPDRKAVSLDAEGAAFDGRRRAVVARRFRMGDCDEREQRPSSGAAGLTLRLSLHLAIEDLA